MEKRNSVRDELNVMLLERLRSETDELRRAMAKKSTTLAQIERVTSTIRKLRLSVELETADASLSEMGVKIDPLFHRGRYPFPRD